MSRIFFTHHHRHRWVCSGVLPGVLPSGRPEVLPDAVRVLPAGSGVLQAAVRVLRQVCPVPEVSGPVLLWVWVRLQVTEPVRSVLRDCPAPEFSGPGVLRVCPGPEVCSDPGVCPGPARVQRAWYLQDGGDDNRHHHRRHHLHNPCLRKACRP